MHALLRALFWYLLAWTRFLCAPCEASFVTSTCSEIRSSCSPCSCTMWATSRKSSFSSPTDCSMLRISDSRSIISDSWKSTSSWDASRSCSCSCCCPNPPCSWVGDPDWSWSAARAAEADARSFSIAWRWSTWNSVREALNSRLSFPWVNFCDGCAGSTR